MLYNMFFIKSPPYVGNINRLIVTPEGLSMELFRNFAATI